MSDIVLSHGYFLWEDEKEQQIMKPYPTLGLLYNAAYLKRAGFDVALYDTTFGNRAELYAKLASRCAPVLGLYTNLITRSSIVQIIGEAKRHGWHVVVGGPESANYPAEYLAHGADVIVIGEGEATLAELLPALRTHGPHRLQHVAGIVFKGEDGEMVRNPERDQIDDIDSIPWPARELIDQQQYVEVWRTHHGMGSVNLITARGCPYKCKWCSHAVFGYSHRRRNYMDCVDEVQHIYEAYKPDQVWYADDVFTISHRWLYDYATELKRRNIKLPFETISRADRMMDERVLATLADMGCYRIWIGSESGSQRILDAMQRGVTVEQVQWATQAAQKHGIEVGMFLMWGYDGEDLSDIEATIDHVKKANPNIYFTTVSYPIKNTPYYKKVEDSLVQNKDWAAATDRDYVIKGRHTRAYYKHADKWLRNEVSAYRLQASDPAQASVHQQEAHAARAALLAVANETE
jgi:radical SAM superfamily enzyme YgiQ (UPF0313 family)